MCSTSASTSYSTSLDESSHSAASNDAGLRKTSQFALFSHGAFVLSLHRLRWGSSNDEHRARKRSRAERKPSDAIAGLLAGPNGTAASILQEASNSTVSDPVSNVSATISASQTSSNTSSAPLPV